MKSRGLYGTSNRFEILIKRRSACRSMYFSIILAFFGWTCVYVNKSTEIGAFFTPLSFNAHGNSISISVRSSLVDRVFHSRP